MLKRFSAATLALLLLSGCDSMGQSYYQSMRSMKDMSLPWNHPQTVVAANTQPGAPVPDSAKGPNAAFSCPPVSIDQDTSHIYLFTDPAHPKPTNEESHAHMATVRGMCTDHGKSILIDISLDIEGGLGPKARAGSSDKPSFSYPYFLAVTDPQGNVIAEQVYATTLSYGPDEQRLNKTETLRQIVPLNGHTGADYHIVLGFQLNTDQIAYNQAHLSGPAPTTEAAPVETTAQAEGGAQTPPPPAALVPPPAIAPVQSAPPSSATPASSSIARPFAWSSSFNRAR
jgi:hypothetical protein